MDDGLDPRTLGGGVPLTPLPHAGADRSGQRAGFDPEALRTGFEVATGDRDHFVAQFFEILVDRHPDLAPVFIEDAERVGTTVLAIIDAVMATADDPEALVTVTERLGIDNRTVGIGDDRYAPIGHALVLAARSTGGAAWTSDLERAWVDGFDIIAELMSAGAATDRARGRPWVTATVVEHVQMRSDIAVVSLRLHEAVLAKPGQHLLVSSPDLPHVWRPYHVVPVPADAREVDLYVQSRRADGASDLLVRAEIGAEFRVGRPHGPDLLRRIGEQDLLAVAVGTGISPVLALVADPAVAQGGRRVQVFYGGRTAEDLVALDRLEAISRRFPRLDVVPVVTTSGDESRLARTIAGIVGSFADWRRHGVITGGPTPLLRPTLDRLHDLGVDNDQLIRADRRWLSTTI